MIPDRETVKVDSNVGGEDIRMAVADGAMAHIMSILTDMYANPALACLREYATNALDAHRAAGIRRPVEVMLPTALRPLLTVRDYGEGLDADDIREIYSQYGASTKRGTNDAVGMLGIGCKSALAYVDAFTLTGIKGGQKITVSISRDESGAGHMRVVETVATDEPAGVIVQIPAKRETPFDELAADYFSYWEPGTVTVNGEAPDPVDGLAVSEAFTVADMPDNAYRRREPAHRRLMVVQGNVPYPAPDGFDHPALGGLPNGKRIVARVPIGTVSFAPSREALMDGAKTRRALSEVCDRFTDAVGEWATAQIDNAPDRAAAVSALADAQAAVGAAAVGVSTWRGETIPATIEALPDTDLYLSAGKRRGYYYGRRSIAERESITETQTVRAQRALWVTDYPNDNWTPSQRRKLDRYAEVVWKVADPGYVDVYLTDADSVPARKWLGSAHIVDWATVRKWKDPEAGTAPRSVTAGYAETYAGTYPAVVAGQWAKRTPLSEITAAKGGVFYTVGCSGRGAILNLAEALPDGCAVVGLTAPRKAKFLRETDAVNPQEATAAARERAQAWVDGLTESEREGLALRAAPGCQSVSRELGSLPISKVTDPALKRIAAVLSAADAKVRDWLVRRSYGATLPGPSASLLADVKAVPTRYPLLRHIAYHGISGNAANHVALYVNAVYAAEREGTK